MAWLYGWALFFGAGLAALCAVPGIAGISRGRVVREDAAIGVLHFGMFALAVVLISRTRSGRDFSHTLIGNLLGVSEADLLSILVSAQGCFGYCGSCGRKSCSLLWIRSMPEQRDF